MKDEARGAALAMLMVARQDDAVRALALVGSQAHGTAGPDADVDFVLLTERPERYLEADDWIETLAPFEPAAPAAPRRWGALTERRLRLAVWPGLELDIGVARPNWAAIDPIDAGTRGVIANGIHRLHDPDRLLGELAAACEVPAPPWLPDSMRHESPMVALRDWGDEDAPALRTVCGDPDVCRFTTVPWTYSPEAARGWVDRQRQKRAEGEALVLAITAPERHAEALGTVNLGRFSADGRKAALGYWLLPAARGRGHATAAARALSRWGFRELGLERIELAILPGNAASQRVAERLGARPEGIRLASHVAEGRSWDMAIYSLQKCG